MTTEQVLRAARAALAAQPSHICQCYGEGGHLDRCPVGKRDRAVEAIERHLAQQRLPLR